MNPNKVSIMYTLGKNSPILFQAHWAFPIYSRIRPTIYSLPNPPRETLAPPMLRRTLAGAPLAAS